MGGILSQCIHIQIMMYTLHILEFCQLYMKMKILNNTSPMKQTIKHAPSNTSVLIYTRIWDNSKYLC